VKRFLGRYVGSYEVRLRLRSRDAQKRSPRYPDERSLQRAESTLLLLIIPSRRLTCRTSLRYCSQFRICDHCDYKRRTFRYFIHRSFMKNFKFVFISRIDVSLNFFDFKAIISYYKLLLTRNMLCMYYLNIYIYTIFK